MSFNPLSPVFAPRGNELQSLLPRSAVEPSANQMQRWILESTSAQAREIARIEQKTAENSQEIDNLQAIVGGDLRLLHSKIKAIGDVVDRRSPDHVSEASEETDQVSNDQKLKESAGPKLLEAAKDSVENIVEFSCCGIAFATFYTLLDHVDDTHLNPKLTKSSSTPSNTESIAKLVENADMVEAQQTSSKTLPCPIQAPWMPVYVRQLKPFEGFIPHDHTETFSIDLIRDLFQGKDFCDGYYFMTDQLDLAGLCIRTYWILDEDLQPYLPKVPGQHGAKLTPLPNEAPVANARDAPKPEHAMNVPTFIRAKDGTYRYYGHYSQSRFQDKLDCDTLAEKVSEHILRRWASKLAEVGRPEWVTQMLILHFFPRPEYWGPTPTNSAVNSTRTGATPSDDSTEPLERRVKESLEAYAYELKEWKKTSRVNASLLTEQEIYDAFCYADGDGVRGLRPYWEYFECVNYDIDFYEFLLHFQRNPQQAVRPAPTPKPRKDTNSERQLRLKQAAIDAAKPTEFVKHNFFNPPPAPRAKFKGTPPHKLAAASKKAQSVNTGSREKSEVQQYDACGPATKNDDAWNPPPVEKKSSTSRTEVWGFPTQNGDAWASASAFHKSAVDTTSEDKQDEPNFTERNSWQGFGDIETARAMSNNFTRAGPGPRRATGRTVPPHMRGR